MYRVLFSSVFLLFTANIVKAADVQDTSTDGYMRGSDYITSSRHYDKLRERNRGREFFNYPILDTNGKKVFVEIPKSGRIDEIREEFVRRKLRNPKEYDAYFSINGKRLSNDMEYNYATFKQNTIEGTIVEKFQMD